MRRHKEILDEITKVVNDYSGPQGFDIVVDKSSASVSSGLPVILYNSSKPIDITDEIIRQLNLSRTVSSAGAPSGAADAFHRPGESFPSPRVGLQSHHSNLALRRSSAVGLDRHMSSLHTVTLSRRPRRRHPYR